MTPFLPPHFFQSAGLSSAPGIQCLVLPKSADSRSFITPSHSLTQGLFSFEHMTDTLGLPSSSSVTLSAPLRHAPEKVSEEVANRVGPPHVLSPQIWGPIMIGGAILLAFRMSKQYSHLFTKSTIGLKKSLTLTAHESAIVDCVVNPEALSVCFDDIGGLLETKRYLRESVVWPFNHPEIFGSLGGASLGVLLYGPPGTGKTMLAKAIAKETHAHFLEIKVPHTSQRSTCPVHSACPMHSTCPIHSACPMNSTYPFLLQGWHRWLGGGHTSRFPRSTAPWLPKPAKGSLIRPEINRSRSTPSYPTLERAQTHNTAFGTIFEW